MAMELVEFHGPWALSSFGFWNFSPAAHARIIGKTQRLPQRDPLRREPFGKEPCSEMRCPRRGKEMVSQERLRHWDLRRPTTLFAQLSRASSRSRARQPTAKQRQCNTCMHVCICLHTYMYIGTVVHDTICAHARIYMHNARMHVILTLHFQQASESEHSSSPVPLAVLHRTAN